MSSSSGIKKKKFLSLPSVCGVRLTTGTLPCDGCNTPLNPLSPFPTPGPDISVAKKHNHLEIIKHKQTHPKQNIYVVPFKNMIRRHLLQLISYIFEHFNRVIGNTRRQKQRLP